MQSRKSPAGGRLPREYGFDAISLMPTNLYGPAIISTWSTTIIGLPTARRRGENDWRTGDGRVGDGRAAHVGLHVDDLRTQRSIDGAL